MKTGSEPGLCDVHATLGVDSTQNLHVLWIYVQKCSVYTISPIYTYTECSVHRFRDLHLYTGPQVYRHGRDMFLLRYARYRRLPGLCTRPTFDFWKRKADISLTRGLVAGFSVYYEYCGAD